MVEVGTDQTSKWVSPFFKPCIPNLNKISAFAMQGGQILFLPPIQQLQILSIFTLTIRNSPNLKDVHSR